MSLKHAHFLTYRAHAFVSLPSDTCDCPRGFVLCGGHCLMGLEDWTDYPTSAALCEARGAHLAVPRTDVEMTCVRQLTETLSNTHIWLGVNDIEVEGEFRGVDGCGLVTIPTSRWQSNEPNGGTTESYVTYSASGWTDSGPGNVKHPLCQLTGCYKPHCL